MMKPIVRLIAVYFQGIDYRSERRHPYLALICVHYGELVCYRRACLDSFPDDFIDMAILHSHSVSLYVIMTAEEGRNPVHRRFPDCSSCEQYVDL